jgi:hypothetical protein
MDQTHPIRSLISDGGGSPSQRPLRAAENPVFAFSVPNGEASSAHELDEHHVYGAILSAPTPQIHALPSEYTSLPVKESFYPVGALSDTFGVHSAHIPFSTPGPIAASRASSYVSHNLMQPSVIPDVHLNIEVQYPHLDLAENSSEQHLKPFSKPGPAPSFHTVEQRVGAAPQILSYESDEKASFYGIVQEEDFSDFGDLYPMLTELRQSLAPVFNVPSIRTPDSYMRDSSVLSDIPLGPDVVSEGLFSKPGPTYHASGKQPRINASLDDNDHVSEIEYEPGAAVTAPELVDYAHLDFKWTAFPRNTLHQALHSTSAPIWQSPTYDKSKNLSTHNSPFNGHTQHSMIPAWQHQIIPVTPPRRAESTRPLDSPYQISSSELGQVDPEDQRISEEEKRPLPPYEFIAEEQPTQPSPNANSPKLPRRDQAIEITENTESATQTATKGMPFAPEPGVFISPLRGEQSTLSSSPEPNQESTIIEIEDRHPSIVRKHSSCIH